MTDRQKILDEFLRKIYCITIELGKLDSLAYDISQMYSGNAFPEQTKLSADILENLMLTVTHDIASEIGLYREDIEMLAKFIEFREKYCEFSDDETSKILDEELPIALKRNFSKRFDAEKNMIARIDRLRQEWNETFENMTYAKLKKKLRI